MEARLELGFGMAESTPDVGTPLSGFIFRENRPSDGIASPLYVRAMVARQGPLLAVLLSYELLALSRSFEACILGALEQEFGEAFARERCVMVATHTHSAPPVYPLQGEVAAGPDYLDRVSRSTLAAVAAARANLAPAAVEMAALRVPGLTYNRRALLAGGRVSMAMEPDELALDRGPVDDTLTAIVCRDDSGRALGVLVHFACHGAASCTQQIGGDIPGEVSRRLEHEFNAPCLYLQGATADMNPTVISATAESMHAWLDQLAPYLDRIPKRLQPLPPAALHIVSADLPLAYRPLPKREAVLNKLWSLDRMAEGDMDAPEVQSAFVLLADLMNIRAGEAPDVHRVAYAAQALADGQRRVLAAIDADQAPAPCPLRLSVWRLGKIAFAFVAAEVFALTGFRIRALGPDFAILPVTYAAPIVGYLPDRSAMARGGYEVNDAWVFYRHPAPFQPAAEEQVLDMLEALCQALPAV
jgi:neutral ceramidase